MLFQAVRGGIESVWVLDRSPGPITPRILTLDLIRSEYTDDDRGCDLSSCRQTIPNGYVVQFSFFGSNVSPFFQILSAMAAILRASVRRAISLRIPLSCKPCR